MGATYEKQITHDDVQAFADISGDHNPIHLDDEFAKDSIFGERVAHGMLTASH
ncbi:MAG TPA: acyl dehydratase, partial [Rhodospirillales bacterium]|nr:acyl dehydratase [Rhodospirillales bacterium]